MARFLKMHGCGNDFVVFDERAGALGLDAGPRRRHRRPAHRRGLRPVHRDRAAAGRLGRRCLHAHPQSRRRRGRRLRQRHPLRRRSCWSRETGRDRVDRSRTVAGDLPLPSCCADGRVRVDMGPARLGLARTSRWRARWTRCTWTWRRPARRSRRRQHGQPARDVLRRRRRGAADRRDSARAGARPAVPASGPISASPQVLAPDRHAAAGVGARRRPDAGLRLRRLRRRW